MEFFVLTTVVLGFICVFQFLNVKTLLEQIQDLKEKKPVETPPVMITPEVAVKPKRPCRRSTKKNTTQGVK
jgi:hypothetical protein